MDERERFQLHFGPYAPPLVGYGQVIRCELRGDVIVSGLSSAKIPWPIGKRARGARARFFVVTGDLVKAIRSEAAIAVAHWWGVTQGTVTKWRKALDVELANDGTHRLRHEYANEPGIQNGLKKAIKAAMAPEVRKKIGNARRGKAMPLETRQKLARAKAGKKLSPEHRRKIGQALRDRRILPVWVKNPWTEKEDELVRTLPGPEVARLTGRSICSVRHRRSHLGVSEPRGFNGTQPVSRALPQSTRTESIKVDDKSSEKGRGAS